MRVSGQGAFDLGPGKHTLQELISAFAKVKEEDHVKPSIEWGRVLGLTLTVVISAGCWVLIIAVLLR